MTAVHVLFTVMWAILAAQAVLVIVLCTAALSGKIRRRENGQ